ncbi:bifunctional DNA-formamidopyrimidine glycosylase/DNA-(apurinic or apyrimidinic site) lyase [Roseibium sp. CAU 1637]|uniref:Formamidopyrimidine-DNA glycosylase n=1 Tax=Roseibium limicola TaxID=2816037 RepID=A0A939EPJ3_9HYPH|nr:bifunctional DNA-formamidopyrimidine glycosylase/DNA-(apurinic or apyrimidinic site) lyase [Roseibium limicola]MBO0346391.1 bifunctional DNA-formamidopyrimidine glycosylase/DNA-(apurinic or apyrimidinic site) lyase [Roseibium limicola]
MPELPEVETVRRGLLSSFEGATITEVEQRRPNLRFPFPDDFIAGLADRKIISLSRRAKYLLADLDSGAVLIMHLGMSGSFRIEAGSTDPLMPGAFALDRSKDDKHDHVVFHLKTASGAPTRVIYNDPRRFGFMLLAARAELDSHPLFAAIGLEPLGNALDGATISRLFAGKAAPLKAALLDQKLIAGLGNIYVCEALWRSGLSPKRQAGSISGKSGRTTQRTENLARHIRETLEEAIEAGGSSLRDHRQADGTLGYFQHRFKVYDREGEPCQKTECNGIITRIVQSGRSTFYCPTCQR